MQMQSQENVATNLRRDLDLITEDELAEMLGVKASTLYSWRTDEIGPDWVKLVKGIYYRRQDVKDWIARNVIIQNRKS